MKWKVTLSANRINGTTHIHSSDFLVKPAFGHPSIRCARPVPFELTPDFQPPTKVRAIRTHRGVSWFSPQPMMKRSHLCFLNHPRMTSAFSAVLVLLLWAQLSAADSNPNVVILFTDDQGTLDVNCYGSTDLKTPNMDKLVATGIRFTWACASCGDPAGRCVPTEPRVAGR